MWVVSFMPRPLYPSTHYIGGCVGPRAGLENMEKWKFLPPPGFELWPLGRPACSQSLYRLRYLGCYPVAVRIRFLFVLFAALTVYNLRVFCEDKTLTQFIIKHYRDSTYGVGGATTLSSFRNTVNTKTPIAVALKAKQFPRIRKHLMIAELSETCGAVTN
jgi:hypothetical protein